MRIAKYTAQGIFYGFVMFFLIVEDVFAQGHHAAVPSHATTQRIAGVQTRIMESRMNLKPHQKQKVNELNQHYLDKLTDLVKAPALTKQEKLEELQRIRESKKSDMKEILNEDQYKEYLKLQQDLKEQRRQRIKESEENGASEYQGEE